MPACDSCYRRKVRCLPQENGICRGCSRTGIQCTLVAAGPVRSSPPNSALLATLWQGVGRTAKGPRDLAAGVILVVVQLALIHKFPFSLLCPWSCRTAIPYMLLQKQQEAQAGLKRKSLIQPTTLRLEALWQPSFMTAYRLIYNALH